MRAVQAAEIARASLRRVHLEEEVVTGNLRVVRDAGMGVVHAPENEGIVLGEGEDFPGILALADLDSDFGTHGFRGALRLCLKIVNRASGMMVSRIPA